MTTNVAFTSFLAMRELSTTSFVVPEPLMAISMSFDVTAGVMVSPMTKTSNPRCMSRMAKALTIRPERPAPTTKILLPDFNPFIKSSTSWFTWLSSISWTALDMFPLISSIAFFRVLVLVNTPTHDS